MWRYNYSNELYHHGILGMKWGVRRFQNKDGTLTSNGKKRKAKELSKAQKKWDNNYKRNWYKAHNATADYVNSTMLPKLNEKYKNIDFTNPKNQDVYKKYMEEYKSKYTKVMSQKVEELFGKRPE